VNLFETLDAETRRRNLQYLIIGGLAINKYGYSRDTADLDIFVCQQDRAGWLALFSELGYTLFHDGGSFVQLTAPAENAWPVDLMLVQEKTFRPIFAASREADLYGTQVRIPALEHLIALKLHALKHTRPHRFLKDFLDVENLIRINRLDIKSEKIRQLFLNYGTLDVYEKISYALASE
jgi:predicted nucleotidyltransferase